MNNNEVNPNSDIPVSEPVATETKPNKYEDTIFKSGYWHGKKPCHLFVNYNVGGHKSFSFVVKTGTITVIHNVDKDNKLSLVRNMLAQLTPEELAFVLQK